MTLSGHLPNFSLTALDIGNDANQNYFNPSKNSAAKLTQLI